ncbi:MAG: zf-HC2 domain-containing protein [Oscillospiraceae bacterium]|nr:zf-HC2 domain-containing protein [Oscillospiraceae bacterium]
MNGCERFQEDLSALLDGMLPEDREREVLAHLAGCPDCAALYDAFDRLSEAMEQEEPPAEVHDRIMERVLAVPARRRRRISWLRPTLAAAACLAVILGAVLTLRGGLLPRMGSSGGSSGSSSAAPESAAAVTAGAGAFDADAEEDVPEAEEAAREAPKEVPEVQCLYGADGGAAENGQTSGSTAAASGSTAAASGSTAAASGSAASDAGAGGDAAQDAAPTAPRLLLTVTGRTADGALLCTVEEDPEGLWPAGTELRLLADAGAPDGDAADYAPGASLWAVPDRRETAEDGGRILYAAALAPAETEE